MSGYRCPLGSVQPVPMDAEQIKRDGWQEQRILVVSLDDSRLDFVQREFVKKLGEMLYGDNSRSR